MGLSQVVGFQRETEREVSCDSVLVALTIPVHCTTV